MSEPILVENSLSYESYEPGSQPKRYLLEYEVSNGPDASDFRTKEKDFETVDDAHTFTASLTGTWGLWERTELSMVSSGLYDEWSFRLALIEEH